MSFYQTHRNGIEKVPSRLVFYVEHALLKPHTHISENADSLEIFHCYLQRQLGFVSWCFKGSFWHYSLSIWRIIKNWPILESLTEGLSTDVLKKCTDLAVLSQRLNEKTHTPNWDILPIIRWKCTFQEYWYPSWNSASHPGLAKMLRPPTYYQAKNYRLQLS